MGFSLNDVAGKRGRAVAQMPAPHPLWVSTELAREHYRITCISFGNQEATIAQLVEAAEKLRSLQLQWKSS